LLDVDLGGHAGLLQPRAGLLDRQRQMAQRVGHPLRVGQVQLGDVPQQVAHALVPGEDVDLQRLGRMRPGLIA
jgi:hypothetical protein